MDNSIQIVCALIFGALGLGFFTYGRRQRAVVPFAVGVALFIIPYLISNLFLLIIVGVALVLMPFFIKV